MTVARMHKQRYVKRNTNGPRFTRQRGIKRGGKDVGPATGATAGTPGSWTPAGADVPGTPADVIGSTITASPATAWTTGQYVQTRVTGAPGRVTWTGSAWVGGAAP